VLQRFKRRATQTLNEDVAVFEALGYRLVAKGPYSRHLEGVGRIPIVLTMVPHGRIVGGNFTLEVSTAEPPFPDMGGLSARGKGVVRLQRVEFKPRRGDRGGAELAARLNASQPVQDALAKVHFDAVRIDPDGRAVIACVGGSVVWMIFPPLSRGVPLVPEQAKATVDALGAFALT
jgi:Protein of unknown function (DUF3156)